MLIFHGYGTPERNVTVSICFLNLSQLYQNSFSHIFRVPNGVHGTIVVYEESGNTARKVCERKNSVAWKCYKKTTTGFLQEYQN
jgi:hypothetical protein